MSGTISTCHTSCELLRVLVHAVGARLDVRAAAFVRRDDLRARNMLGLLGSLKTLVKAMTCEVSVPMIPEAPARQRRELPAQAGTKCSSLPELYTVRRGFGPLHSTHVRERRRPGARRDARSQGPRDRRGPARLRAVPLRRPQQREDDRAAGARRDGDGDRRGARRRKLAASSGAIWACSKRASPMRRAPCWRANGFTAAIWPTCSRPGRRSRSSARWSSTPTRAS